MSDQVINTVKDFQRKAGEKALELIQEYEPKMIPLIKEELKEGKTPTQIADEVATRDVFLAGIVEMAAEFLRKDETDATHKD